MRQPCGFSDRGPVMPPGCQYSLISPFADLLPLYLLRKTTRRKIHDRAERAAQITRTVGVETMPDGTAKKISAETIQAPIPNPSARKVGMRTSITRSSAPATNQNNQDVGSSSASTPITLPP